MQVRVLLLDPIQLKRAGSNPARKLRASSKRSPGRKKLQRNSRSFLTEYVSYHQHRSDRWNESWKFAPQRAAMTAGYLPATFLRPTASSVIALAESVTPMAISPFPLREKICGGSITKRAATVSNGFRLLSDADASTHQR
jgi:hypothetical protein